MSNDSAQSGTTPAKLVIAGLRSRGEKVDLEFSDGNSLTIPKENVPKNLSLGDSVTVDFTNQSVAISKPEPPPASVKKTEGQEK